MESFIGAKRARLILELQARCGMKISGVTIRHEGFSIFSVTQ